MQKNKKLLFILIPGTLLLWGMIVYKIYKTVGGSNDDMPFVQNNRSSDSTINNNNDTFSLHFDYRDPFKEGKTMKPATSNSTLSNTTIKVAVAKQTTKTITNHWPEIIYSGMIKNQKSSMQLVLVQINSKSTSMKVGDAIDGVELTKVCRDSIEVKFGKEKRFILK